MGSTGLYVAVYQMSESDKRALDKIEGVGEGYVDATIAVPGIGDCATYVAADSRVDDTLNPYDWYKELVLLGCEKLGLPAAYIQRIARVSAISDPDTGRRGDNWKIVDMLRASPATE